MNESNIEDNKNSKKNIREIYLKAVNNNKGFFRKNKKKRISNLQNQDTCYNASTYLEKEYNLVKRIIKDTKELKTIKNKNELTIKDEFVHTTPTRCPTRPSAVSNFKTIEEYSRELLELKKTLKIYQENEIINKAKFEYYDNELSKKEQEIIELLDNKKNEELRIHSDSKSDLLAFIYHLKQKSYKLEFSLKRKENEYNKLQNDIKTTNLKQITAQNERLRTELNRSLMNEKKIIEVFQKEGVIEKNGLSYYDSESRKLESDLSLYHKQKIKEDIVNELTQERFEDQNHFKDALQDFKHKIPLKGSLEQKLEILDLRETELLKEIKRLNYFLEEKEIEQKLNLSSSMVSLKTESMSKRPIEKEKRTQSIEKIQLILRGHLERISNLKQTNDKQRPFVKEEDDDEHFALRGSRESLNKNSKSRSDNYRHNRKEKYERSPSNLQTTTDHSHQNNNRDDSLIVRRRHSIIDSSLSDLSTRSENNSTRNLIEEKKVPEVDSKGVCCGAFKSCKTSTK